MLHLLKHAIIFFFNKIIEYDITKLAKFKGIAHLVMAKSHAFVLMQISYPYIVWDNFPKFQENHASNFWDMRQSMGIIGHYWGMGIPNQGGGRVHWLDRYLFRGENKKITRRVPIQKLKFYILFFFLWILKVLQIGEDQEGRQEALFVQKKEKITRTVPILKSNSTQFFFFFLSTIHIKNFTNWGARGQARGGVDFFFLIFQYYFINVIIKTLYITSFCCFHYIFYT